AAYTWCMECGQHAPAKRMVSSCHIIIDSPEYHLALVITPSTSGTSALVLVAQICSFID
ncbi:hypothetical protein KXV89_002932, partial [Aspergillus fumigatus]